MESTGSEQAQQLARQVRDEIVGRQWDRVQSLLQQVPEGERLVRRLPGEEHSWILYIFSHPDIPVDILRSILAAVSDIGLYDWVDDEPPTTLLHATLLSGFDITRIQAIAEFCPKAITIETETLRSPIFVLMNRRIQRSAEEKARIMAVLLRVCPNAAIQVDPNGMNLLHQAVLLSVSLEVIHVVVETRPSMMHEPDSLGAGMTPLHYAASMSDPLAAERLELLLQYGDKTSLLRATLAAKHRESPLQTASVSSNPNARVIDLLVEARPEACYTYLVGRPSALDLFRLKFKDSLHPTTLDEQEMIRLVNLGNCALALFTAKPSHSRPRLHDVLRSPDLPLDVVPAIACAGRAEVCQPDDNGDLPLHALARRTPAHDDADVYTQAVKTMIQLHPDACRVLNRQWMLPLQVMKDAGHSLQHGMMPLVETHPAAVMDLNLHPLALLMFVSSLAQKSERDDDVDLLFRLLQAAPDIIKIIFSSPMEVASWRIRWLRFVQHFLQHLSWRRSIHKDDAAEPTLRRSPSLEILAEPGDTDTITGTTAQNGGSVVPEPAGNGSVAQNGGRNMHGAAGEIDFHCISDEDEVPSKKDLADVHHFSGGKLLGGPSSLVDSSWKFGKSLQCAARDFLEKNPDYSIHIFAQRELLCYLNPDGLPSDPFEIPVMMIIASPRLTPPPPYLAYREHDASMESICETGENPFKLSWVPWDELFDSKDYRGRIFKLHSGRPAVVHAKMTEYEKEQQEVLEMFTARPDNWAVDSNGEPKVTMSTFKYNLRLLTDDDEDHIVEEEIQWEDGKFDPDPVVNRFLNMYHTAGIELEYEPYDEAFEDIRNAIRHGYNAKREEMKRLHEMFFGKAYTDSLLSSIKTIKIYPKHDRYTIALPRYVGFSFGNADRVVVCK